MRCSYDGNMAPSMVTELPIHGCAARAMTTIVVNCSKRKRVASIANLAAQSLARGSLDEVIRRWNERVTVSERCIEAGRLYLGRQFHEALQAKITLNAEMLIVSAGLGVLRLTDRVPSYSLTVAPGSSDSILERVEDEVTAADWWTALTQKPHQFRSLDAMLADSSDADGLILIALPSPYLRMLEHELEQFPPQRRAQTRIFTGPSYRFRDARLDRLLMPYDARLDGPNSSSPGTAADFASRALRDFTTFVLPLQQGETCEVHAAAVLSRLSNWKAATRPERSRRSDEELMDIIRANWSTAGGSASRMLRRIRSELGLACEQGRMRELHAAVQKDMEKIS